MSVIEDKANEIAIGIQSDRVTLILDIVTIAAIVGIITDLITIYKKCGKPAPKAASELRDDSIIARWQVRRAVRTSKLQNKQEILSSMLKVGKTITDSEMISMYQEVG